MCKPLHKLLNEHLLATLSVLLGLLVLIFVYSKIFQPTDCLSPEEKLAVIANQWTAFGTMLLTIVGAPLSLIAAYLLWKTLQSNREIAAASGRAYLRVEFNKGQSFGYSLVINLINEGRHPATIISATIERKYLEVEVSLPLDRNVTKSNPLSVTMKFKPKSFPPFQDQQDRYVEAHLTLLYDAGYGLRYRRVLKIEAEHKSSQTTNNPELDKCKIVSVSETQAS